MWANAQHDGRPVEYRWRPLFNAAKFGFRVPNSIPTDSQNSVYNAASVQFVVLQSSHN